VIGRRWLHAKALRRREEWREMMDTRRALLRGAAALALAVAVVGTTVVAPSASAAPLTGTEDLRGVAEKPKKEKSEAKSDSDDSGLSDVPVIGDVVGVFKDAEPEEIVAGAVTFAGVAAETAIPLIRSLIK
jgi:hypothetical protein